VTVNRSLSTLLLMYNDAERCSYQVSNPVKGVEFCKEIGRTRIISLEEETSYLSTASQPLRDIARILLDVGTRPEEVFRIEVANLDFSKRTIFNPFGTTPAARSKLTMTEEVCSILKARALDAKNEFVFPSPEDPECPIGSVRKAHDAAVRRAKIEPRFRLYDLRHTHHGRLWRAWISRRLLLCSGTRAFR
jgi:integrase